MIREIDIPVCWSIHPLFANILSTVHWRLCRARPVYRPKLRTRPPWSDLEADWIHLGRHLWDATPIRTSNWCWVQHECNQSYRRPPYKEAPPAYHMSYVVPFTALMAATAFAESSRLKPFISVCPLSVVSPLPPPSPPKTAERRYGPPCVCGLRPKTVKFFLFLTCYAPEIPTQGYHTLSARSRQPFVTVFALKCTTLFSQKYE